MKFTDQRVVLVCGGRLFADIRNHFHKHFPHRFQEYLFVFEKLNQLREERGGNWRVVAGAATGVDTAAADWGRSWGLGVVEYPAEWERYGKAAGYIRNRQMLREEKPELVVAFNGGPGTQNMLTQAAKAGIEVIRYEYQV